MLFFYQKTKKQKAFIDWFMIHEKKKARYMNYSCIKEDQKNDFFFFVQNGKVLESYTA